MYSFDKKFLHLMGNKTVMKIGFLLHTLFCYNIKYIHQLFPLQSFHSLYRTAAKMPDNSGFFGITYANRNQPGKVEK